MFPRFARGDACPVRLIPWWVMAVNERARAWVEVDLDALRANFDVVRARAGGAGVIAMVKADSYGVGAERVVAALEPHGPLAYGVATANEGAQVRAFGIERPIIVFSPLPPGSIDLAAAARLTATLSDLAGVERWAEAAGRHGSLDAHLEIDTGMGRAGFDWREVGTWADRLHEALGAGVRLRGVYTHLHSADAPDATPTMTQWQRFQDALAQLPFSREDLLVHVCNSAGVMRWPEFALDAVRPGIYLYGGDPAPGVGGFEPPRPVVSVHARVVRIKDAPPGSTVGYGSLYTARGWERWATLPLGYGDGWARSLTGRSEAIIRGQRVPFIGRTSMDMTVVDISSVPDVVVGDVATMLGSDGNEAILIEDVAAQAGTISYEILTGLRPRLPRLERYT